MDREEVSKCMVVVREEGTQCVVQEEGTQCVVREEGTQCVVWEGGNMVCSVGGREHGV